MARVRQKFVEVEGAEPELYRRILQMIRYLFMQERVAWTRSPEERLRIRQENEKPVLDSLTKLIKERLHQGGLLPKAKLTQALHYYRGLAPSFENYLTNPNARLDNNVAERAICPLTIGRKNWMFVGSENGGQVADIFMSLIQTCRHLGINPQEYLEDILRRIMSHPARRIEDFLPDHWLAARQKNAAVQTAGQDGLSSLREGAGEKPPLLHVYPAESAKTCTKLLQAPNDRICCMILLFNHRSNISFWAYTDRVCF